MIKKKLQETVHSNILLGCFYFLYMFILICLAVLSLVLSRFVCELLLVWPCVLL